MNEFVKYVFECLAEATKRGISNMQKTALSFKSLYQSGSRHEFCFSYSERPLDFSIPQMLSRVPSLFFPSHSSLSLGFLNHPQGFIYYIYQWLVTVQVKKFLLEFNECYIKSKHIQLYIYILHPIQDNQRVSLKCRSKVKSSLYVC